MGTPSACVSVWTGHLESCQKNEKENSTLKEQMYRLFLKQGQMQLCCLFGIFLFFFREVTGLETRISIGL